MNLFLLIVFQKYVVKKKNNALVTIGGEGTCDYNTSEK